MGKDGLTYKRQGGVIYNIKGFDLQKGKLFESGHVQPGTRQTKEEK